MYSKKLITIYLRKEAGMEKLKKMLNKETILYVVFGLLTSIINIAVFEGWRYVFGEDSELWATTVAFIAAATVAYITNKLFVFETKSWSPEVLRKEIPAFFSARIFSFFLEWIAIFVATRFLNSNEFYILGFQCTSIVKLGMTVVVVILNYIFSKFWIFKKKKS